jgi:broad specificity phosphatase PhoE
VTLTLHLVRHLPHIHQGRIHVGRMDGIELAEGAAERMRLLGRRYDGMQLDAVYASPSAARRRRRAPSPAPAGLEILTRPDLTELDAGEWTGMSFRGHRARPARAALERSAQPRARSRR